MTQSPLSQESSNQCNGQPRAGNGEKTRERNLILLGIALGLVIFALGIVASYYNLAGQGRYIPSWIVYRGPLVILALMLLLLLLKKGLDAIDKRDGGGSARYPVLRKCIEIGHMFGGIAMALLIIALLFSTGIALAIMQMVSAIF